MRTPILLLALLAPSFLIPSFSQGTTGTSLTWMKGDNTVNQAGVYGTLGVANSLNKPGARDYAATWTDASGLLWMYGGYGYDQQTQGYLNDLWRFDPNNNTWTWVMGNNTCNQYGNYGTKGVASASNRPGSLYAAMSWTDREGSLWLFGGFGYSSSGIGFLNDLWKFDPNTGSWTWMQGNNAVDMPAVYGTKGITAPGNRPGSRYGSRTWVDRDGDLWLFGGYGLDAGETGTLNDLWKFDISTNQWTWMGGDNSIDRPGIYGTKGIASVSNQPGARYLSNAWTDNEGKFWLFGGYGYDETSPGILNDLWKFDPSTNEWTWLKGDKTGDQPANFGTQEMPASGNQPGARYVSVSWSDATGDLWLFGGYGYDASQSGYLNDLWKFDINSSTWTWMRGDTLVDQVAVYGVQGVPAHTNKSGARNSCISWADKNGNLWLFGGYGYDQNSSGVLNDLWRITELYVLPLQILRFNGTLRDNIAQLEWSTSQEEGIVQFNLQRSFDGRNFSNIALINGRGQEGVNDYAFPDNLQGQPASRIFYRLEMILPNGERSYSRLIRLEQGGSANRLSLFKIGRAHV